MKITSASELINSRMHRKITEVSSNGLEGGEGRNCDTTCTHSIPQCSQEQFPSLYSLNIPDICQS